MTDKHITIDHTKNMPCPEGWSRAVIGYRDVTFINWVAPASIEAARRSEGEWSRALLAGLTDA